MLTLVLAVVLVRSSAAQPALQRPQDGVLMLKHGTTLSGFITPAGDRYVVLLGESGEARVPAADVIAVVDSLQDAYEFKRARLDSSLAAHIDLAQWCLQQNLPARAADQLLAAERRFGRNLQLDALHQRLLAAARAQRAATQAQQPRPEVAQVSFDEVITKVSGDSIDAFNTTVQPLLLNRCASGGCHNMRGTSEYVLFRPFVGQATTRRLTERNLQATLAYVDRAAPQESSLLAKAIVAHGGAPTAAIEPREQKQLEILSDWLRGLQPVSRSVAEPTTIAPANELLYQPGQLSPKRPAAMAAEASHTPPTQKAVAPAGDPFDPAAFNQRHHGRTQ